MQLHMQAASAVKMPIVLAMPMGYELTEARLSCLFRTPLPNRLPLF